MKYDWRQVFSFFQRFSTRERLLLGGTAGAMLVIGLYTLVWEPLTEARALMQRRIDVKMRELGDIRRMRDNYLDLLRQFEASQTILDTAEENFSLFPYIEATVADVVGRDRIASMNPKTKVINDAYHQESVELKLTAISLEQLVDMMYRIEKGQHPLRVTRLQVKKRRRDPRTFDVTATVSMLEPTDT